MKTAADLTKVEILALLDSFANQRPGIEPGNYHDYRSYRAEAAEVTRDLADFRKLFGGVWWRDEITADTLREELNASRRLSLDEAGRLSYCTGQYFPTEYRKAACRVLASLLWSVGRDGAAYPWAQPTPEGRKITGDSIRAWARREFGRRIASRYFN